MLESLQKKKSDRLVNNSLSQKTSYVKQGARFLDSWSIFRESSETVLSKYYRSLTRDKTNYGVAQLRILDYRTANLDDKIDFDQSKRFLINTFIDILNTEGGPAWIKSKLGGGYEWDRNKIAGSINQIDDRLMILKLMENIHDDYPSQVVREPIGYKRDIEEHGIEKERVVIGAIDAYKGMNNLTAIGGVFGDGNMESTETKDAIRTAQVKMKAAREKLENFSSYSITVDPSGATRIGGIGGKTEAGTKSIFLPDLLKWVESKNWPLIDRTIVHEGMHLANGEIGDGLGYAGNSTIFESADTAAKLRNADHYAEALGFANGWDTKTTLPYKPKAGTLLNKNLETEEKKKEKEITHWITLAWAGMADSLQYMLSVYEKPKDQLLKDYKMKAVAKLLHLGIFGEGSKYNPFSKATYKEPRVLRPSDIIEAEESVRRWNRWTAESQKSVDQKTYDPKLDTEKIIEIMIQTSNELIDKDKKIQFLDIFKVMKMLDSSK